ncbi:MAG: GDP-mannose 4,6-dehydratase [Candidatus Korobacteraceae bacterium]
MKGTPARTVLITGGAGFIGSNLTERLLAEPGTRVRVFDNFSRRGVEHNVEWLRTLRGSTRVEIVQGDVRDFNAVRQAVADVSAIYHLAAQVAVTTSVDDPASDFAVNAQGTLHVLEAARLSGLRPFVLFTSTNKVYGSLKSVPVEVEGSHYRATDRRFRGVNESEPLDFHSPYGCSKGAADQYVRDYARIYDLPTVVFRMSCIAGTRQFGNEDQGWVAHFLYSALEGRPITVYGTGYQVRDVLHVHDLIDAMLAAERNAAHTTGQIYNLGGGMERAVSVIQMLREIELRTEQPLNLRYSSARPGDQPLYVSDTRKLEGDTGWRPRHSVAEVLDAIHEFWLWSRGRVSAPKTVAFLPSDLLKQEVA